MPVLSAVEHIDPSSGLEGTYDAFVACVGFEARARFVSQELGPIAKRRIAWAFGDRHVATFDTNSEWFTQKGFEYLRLPESAAESWAESLCREMTPADGHPLRICVDISSMSRLRLGAVIAALLRVSKPSGIVVDFVYALAAWSPPARDPEPIVTAGAVLPVFAGWSDRPELPTVAIIGLGYEPDKAVGAYEYLEATGVWAFLPHGTDPRYETAIQDANSTLLKQVPKEHRIPYRVDQPVTCFSTLEAVTFGAMTTSRPVLLPFGPKIFALCALLVACVHRDVPVWRVSSGELGEPLDRVASGKVLGLRAVFTGERPRVD